MPTDLHRADAAPAPGKALLAVRLKPQRSRVVRPYSGLVRIVVTGAAGMLGDRLVERLVAQGVLGAERLSHIRLVDVVAPPRPVEAGDISV
ncbi:MAG: hypothetical protein M3018_00860, partial [Actinomycetota bacterium]|nr:hypothetical protein [Actinomycetota bacterium]